METQTNSAVDRKSRRYVGAVALVLLALAFALTLAVRVMSPSLGLGTTITHAQCQGPLGAGDLCYRHVERDDWLFLAPVDDYQVYVRGHSAHHSVGNPWVDDAKLSVILEDSGITLTDGQIGVQVARELFDGLRNSA